MKTIKPFVFILFAVFLFSCNRGTELKSRSYENYVLQRLQKSVVSEYYRGKEKLGAIKETYYDKSERNRSIRCLPILNSAQGIDSACHTFMQKVNDLKSKMIKDKSELKRFRKRKNYNWLEPIILDFDHLRIYNLSKTQTKIKLIRSELIKLRKYISQRIVNRESGDSTKGRYFFIDPVLGDFDSDLKFTNSIQKAIVKSNVAQDDKEALKRIYAEMSKLAYSFPTEVADGVQLFTLLTSLEIGIYSVRADAIALLRSRIGCCACYSFDRIIPLLNAPSVSFPGDTVEVSGLMSAYDSDKAPIVVVNGTEFKDIRRGIAYHKFIIEDEKDLKLKGTVTILNKSGVPKTMPFEKTIKVLPKRE